MERAIFVRMKRLVIAAVAAALGACTGPGSPEAELPDSALTQVPADPVAAPQPVQAESVTRAPSQAPTASQPARPTPAQPSRTEPPLRQPPPPRDTRPSIPWPPDTL